MRPLPDFQLELINSIDFVLGSPLGRYALTGTDIPDLPNILRDLLEDIDRLAKNCHLPEFTDHSLPHICSLVKRLSDWGQADGWLEALSSTEAGYLLLAIIVHDAGMLSQDPAELEGASDLAPKGLAELSDWVRRTHVARLGGLLRHLFERRGRTAFPAEKLNLIVALGKAHQSWPWQSPSGFALVESAALAVPVEPARARGIAALVAVADLLDEDATRCDTATLIQHRMGTTLNRAHWLRHGLTRDRVEIRDRTVKVTFVNVPTPPPRMDQVFRALRNHFRLILLYEDELSAVGASIEHLDFDPCTGSPKACNSQLHGWIEIPEFNNCLSEQLLLTFMREALNDPADAIAARRLASIGLELVDLTAYHAFRGRAEPLTDEERVFLHSLTSN